MTSSKKKTAAQQVEKAAARDDGRTEGTATDLNAGQQGPKPGHGEGGMGDHMAAGAVGNDRGGCGGRRLPLGGEGLGGLASEPRLPRREVNRARRIILQQRRFTQASTKRFRPLLFMRSEEFPESLELFATKVIPAFR